MVEEVETWAGENGRGGKRWSGDAGEFLNHGAEVGGIGGENGGRGPARGARAFSRGARSGD